MPRTYIDTLRDHEDGAKVVVYGWMQEARIMKNISFLMIRDNTGTIQATFKNDEATLDIIKRINRESIVRVDGSVNKKSISKAGIEISGTSISIVNEAEAPLPLPVVDPVQADLETRLNSRFMDLRKRNISAIFRIESALLWGIRQYLHSQKFIEVHTPKIVAAATEGGSDLFPVRYFEKDAYLNQSPQLYKEVLMSAGFDRVFEVGPAFRAEEHNTTRHLNEFTSIDIEMSFADHNDAMAMLENAIRSGIENAVRENAEDFESLGISISVPETPFPRITYEQCIDLLQKDGIDFTFGDDFSPDQLRTIGSRFSGFYFITEWPSSVRPFYTMPKSEDPRLTNSFDLQYREIEVTSGAQRVHDPKMLIQRFNEKKLDVKSFQFYVDAFKYGMPPHAGWGLGLERLTMILLGLNNIRETTLFPRDRTRIVP
ncbi:aspartyl-tRNA synthetase related protein [Thermoplasma acidophilum]|uniref:Aspartate--tRNA(Asp) ligase n=1 Tax=Thermoplasma acidophilum (strain ATCC 25905 / DSM 1728 / JCM 9062 / NBRC 15155 / AMRC-C165) TaxID=273075 RepID=SYD_THEAC|nr:aspartate--tRNA(Asn) ligase [Thermoplasma acidophilum]Q9HJM1.1 RecName: Full=Aspartate--tRNA(Asp) ligase; AltName: Full=Aspartyl-tRNA synthetase; Short=AspRS; AltName: Full=Discriminating aspartyl-tRNA synthetase; Short=D-AspRS [Thermoplasma acidophilum DSM 1728]CAC12075.1 aspartyl-tRNA synthetase related protein [Thermoplasma acidophilum]